MRFYRLFSLLPLFLLLTQFSGCTLENVKPITENPDLTAAELALCGGSIKNWQPVSIRIKGDTTLNEKDTTYLPPCLADDLHSFRADTSYTYQNNATCNATDAQGYAAFWKLTNNNRYLNIEAATFNRIYTVDTLTDTLLTITYNRAGSPPEQYRFKPKK